MFSELRRRNVLKVALAYVLASLLVFWLVGGLMIWLGAPDWANEFLLLVLAIGFPVALIFAWAYEITPSGLKKSLDVDQTQSIVFKTGQKLNAAVLVLAVLGALALIGEQLLPTFEFPKIIEPILPAPVYEKPDKEGVPAEIRAHTLKNGLRIIVWPDHDIPNVVMYNYVRAGGRNEYPGITGLSHFFEHMMFNGTEKRAQGAFDETMEAAGGSNNAYTSEDLTVYQDWFPRTALETVFDLEGDRLKNLAIEPSVVETERGIVYSERRLRYDNDNFGRLYLEMNATAFIAHPYQFPVIGWASDIENWTQEDLESYFETYYAPNNLTMVFTGDVKPEEIFNLARKHFGSIPAQEPPQAIRTVEPEQLGERRLLIEVDAPTPLLHIAFHAGNATDPRTLPMNVLLNILVGGSSSRLHQVLVEQEQLALSIGGFQMEGFDPGLVYFYLTLPPGADVNVVETRLLEELQRVVTDGVTDAELAKARNIMIADYWRSLATINGKAATLGRAEVFFGDYQDAFSLPVELEQVSAEQIQAVAGDVFNRKQMTVGVLRSPIGEDAK
ncbi:MAG TPA: pitrilysin family protein [Woeseiaceae bacterium]|nr:pitrilysin family protein [Woeseiaceae bacterium]